MAYTTPWDDTKPQGTIDAKTLDDEIRALRVDINERMTALLGSAWSSDPVVAADSTILALKAAADLTGEKTSSRRISWFAGKYYGAVGTVAETDDYVQVTGPNGALTVVVPLNLPHGATLTKIKSRATMTGAGHTLTWLLRIRSGSTTTDDNLTGISVAVGKQEITDDIPNVLVDSDNTYYIVFTLNNNNLNTTEAIRIHDVWYEFTTPNAGVR